MADLLQIVLLPMDRFPQKITLQKEARIRIL
jgi:hypothetical protein